MSRPSNTDQRRAQIVRGLIAVMAKHGYDGATIADVGQAADLTPGLVHYHFKNKLEILVEVVRLLAAEHVSAVDMALADLADPADQLDAFIDVHLGVGQHANPANLACWVQITAEAVRQPRIRREVEHAFADLAMRLEKILEGCDRARQVDPDVAAAALLATIQGYFVLSATAREVIPAGTAAKATKHMAAGLLQPRSRGGRA